MRRMITVAAAALGFVPRLGRFFLSLGAVVECDLVRVEAVERRILRLRAG
jgi:hypothetical protein